MGMKTIGCNEPPLTEVVPASQDERPVKCSESSKATEPGERLAQENKRLAQENARLRQEYDLLRTLIDSLPDRIFIKDRQSRFLINNPAHVRAMGATCQDEVIGKTDLDIFPPELARQYYNDERTVMESGQPLNREEMAVNPRTNETRWLQTTKMPLLDKQRVVVGLMGISRDITELKRTEEAMAGAHLLLQAILDNVPDRIYFKDTQSRFLKLSKTLAKRLGVKDPEEAVGKTDFDFNPTEKAEEFYQDEQRIIRTGEALINKTERQILPNGEIAWTSTTKVPLRDKAGKVVGIAGINRDITEQKRTEEALRQSRDELEQRVAKRTAELSQERLVLRTLIDNLPDAIYTKDAAGRKSLVNPADLKNYRCKTEAEAIGKSDFDLFPPDIAEKFWADDQRVLHGQPVLKREEFFFDEKSRKRWLLTSKLPLRDQSGKIVGLVGIGSDITERKQAEEALAQERLLLRTLIDNLPDFIYAKDKEGRFVLNNLAHAGNLGAKSPEEMKGKSDFDFFPRELAEQFYNDEQNIIKTGRSVINQEQYKVSPGDKSGQKHWSISSKVLWRDNNGHVLGTVGVTHDIHEMKMAQEALRKNEEKLRQFTGQLERSNRELQDFAYVASHDLQEPLRKIVVFGERLKEQGAGKLDAEACDYLERMQKAASRMQTLINDLLSFSRVTTKARPFVQVDLAEVAHEVVNDLEGRIEQVKGRVEVGALPIIDAEALQMRQLLQNLIGNALKFRRPEVPPVVKVAAEIIAGPSREGGTGIAKKLCRLTVSDNGIGFDEKYLDRIFNVFQRLHSRNEYEGTGMGLAIARKIAVFHHGDITAKSKPGSGATFIVTLPATHHKETNNGVQNE
jgi:PAS domain S-box-containing protein